MSAGSRAMGGLKGAGTGAAIGSVIPGLGTLAGAGIGGAIGALSSGGDDAPAGPQATDNQAQLQQGMTADQVTQQYNNSQQGIQGQQAFVNSLLAQGGVQNQSAAMQAQQGLAGQQAAANGVGNQSSTFGQMQGLANQYQGLANGTGPNPAMAQLNQTTGQNVANQAALMAGQRGAGSNVGLMARQAGQQGAATQQQAVGQGATMAAQQQIAAMQGLQNQQGAMAGLASTQVGQQMGQQQAAANTAGQQVSNLANASNAYTNAAQNQYGMGLNSVNAANANQVALQGQRTGMQENINNVNAGMAQQQQAQQHQDTKDIIQGAGTAAVAMGGSGGGGGGGAQDFSGANGIGGFADGGMVGPTSLHSHIWGTPVAQQTPPQRPMMARGGKVPALVSPGEVYLPPEKVKDVAKHKKDPISSGEKIPGKAKVKGDSLKNDTVSKTLEAGGIVIPRHVMESKDPHKAAAKFVAAVLAKKGLK